MNELFGHITFPPLSRPLLRSVFLFPASSVPRTVSAVCTTFWPWGDRLSGAFITSMKETASSVSFSCDYRIGFDQLDCIDLQFHLT